MEACRPTSVRLAFAIQTAIRSTGAGFQTPLTSLAGKQRKRHRPLRGRMQRALRVVPQRFSVRQLFTLRACWAATERLQLVMPLTLPCSRTSSKRRRRTRESHTVHASQQRPLSVTQLTRRSMLSDAIKTAVIGLVSGLFGGLGGAALVGLAGDSVDLSVASSSPVLIDHPSGRAIRIDTVGFDSPAVHFLDTDGSVIFELMTTPTGHALMEMRNPNTGEPSIRLDTATPTGAARLIFFDPATGKPARTITFDSE